MNIMESHDWLWPGPYLGILHPWAQENFEKSDCDSDEDFFGFE
jgi:hypothetical protein